MEKYFSVKGYPCLRFNYPTRTKTIDNSARLLHEWITAKQINSADFICHSMGGLVCRAYFENYLDFKPTSNVVCLGSPFTGSIVAQKLSNSKYGTKLLGVQIDSQLTKGVSVWPENFHVGVIAGNRNFGAGRLLGLPGSQPGDGTILVDETRIRGLSDHIILPVTHTQLTFSKSVAEQAEHFIKYQQFNHGNDSH